MSWECHAWYECHWAHGWKVALVANTVLLIAYIGIAYHIFHRVHRTGQWRENVLARGAAALFFTCSVGHGLVASHLLLPTFGIEEATGLALRQGFNEWHMFLWPPVVAAAGVYYWLNRMQAPSMMGGAGLFEDLDKQRQQAMEIHDDVVQRIATAKMALEHGDEEAARDELDRAMDHSQEIISELLGPDEEEGLTVEPGDLRRERAAGDVS